MKYVAVLLMLTLCGCAETMATYKGYRTAAVQAAKNTMDLHLETMKIEVCSMPISALIRNPEWYDSVKSLCLGNSATSIEEILINAQEGAE